MPKLNLLPTERAFLSFWESKRGGRAMPRRADFIAEDLSGWLPFVHLLRPINGDEDFEYLVYSTRSSVNQRVEMTKRRVSDWEEPRRHRALTLYRTVILLAAPVYQALPERFDMDTLWFTRVCVPFGDDSAVTHILTLLTERETGAVTPVPPTPILLEPAASV